MVSSVSKVQSSVLIFLVTLLGSRNSSKHSTGVTKYSHILWFTGSKGFKTRLDGA